MEKENNASLKGRREFIRQTALGGLAVAAIPSLLKSEPSDSLFSEENVFTLPPLPYGYDALEPHIDKMTMEIHHDKHHKAYVDNLNKAVADNKITGSLEEIIKNVSKYPVAVRNNAGGHWNHSFFWKLMTAPKREDGKSTKGGGMPSGKLATTINGTFESFDKFKAAFNDAAMKRFGSGWAWLVSKNGKLEIGSTPNQDNPLMDISDFKGTPIMAIDVWEHAYYLKYQNKRADYINNWWNVINWDQVAENFTAAK